MFFFVVVIAVILSDVSLLFLQSEIIFLLFFRYKEINPAVFGTITFPFLFGIMYGDIGHGLIITLVAAFFIIREKQLMASGLNEIVGMVFGGPLLSPFAQGTVCL